ncbi:MAG: hypothetical protein K8R58_10555 [Bacteroidales bacterium]|nr:hypothetical protein [Bacteroidales bacterium]
MVITEVNIKDINLFGSSRVDNLNKSGMILRFVLSKKTNKISIMNEIKTEHIGFS